MGGLRCVDGSCLTVTPRACTDGAGVPYEVILELALDGSPYGVVGERCGWLLARLACAVVAARERADAAWPDPDDRFPEPGAEAGLFALRYRAAGTAGIPRSAAGGGLLRCQVRTVPVWEPLGGGAGEWRLTRRAVIELRESTGSKSHAVLTAGHLAEFTGDLAAEARLCMNGRDLVQDPLEGTGSPWGRR